MLTVEDYARIRRAHRDGLSIRSIAKRYHHSRRKVRERVDHGPRCAAVAASTLGIVKLVFVTHHWEKVGKDKLPPSRTRAFRRTGNGCRCGRRGLQVGGLKQQLLIRRGEVPLALWPEQRILQQRALNRRSALSHFLEDGRIELDTSLLERSLRGPALGRKNYLFFGSLGGGHTAATLYSVVQSAKLYQLAVTAYLTDTLRRLAALLPTDTSAIRELLPDRWALAHPEHILQARQQESLAAHEKRRHRRAGRRLAAMGDVD